MNAGAPPGPCLSRAWQAHRSELAGFLRRRVADRATADDLLQDTWLRALRQGERFCGIADPRAWLFHVARNLLVDHARANRDFQPLTDDLAQDPVEAATIDELTVCLPRVLQTLPPRDVEILRACDLGDSTQARYAQAHGLSLPAAKARLQRARRRLRAQLTHLCQVRLDPDGQVAGYTRLPAARG